MASGTGVKYDRTHTYAVGTSGYGYLCLEAYVTQTVNSSARSVTISVVSSLTYHRNVAWTSPGTSGISWNNTNTNYIQATVDGEQTKTTSSQTRLGLKCNNKNLAAGTDYNIRAPKSSGSAYVTSDTNSQVTKSKTFYFNDNGDAITKSWSAGIKYGSVTMSLSGSVTTDSIAPAYSNPEGLDASVSSKTDTSATINVSVTSYGNPASASGRYLRGAVLGSSTYGDPYRYTDASNVSSASVLVDNSSSMGTTTLNITGNTEYYYGAYANNTQKSVNIVKGTFVTLPAYITSVGSVDNGHGSITFTVNHNAEGSAYTVQNQYSLDQTTWTNMSNSVTFSLADTTTVYFRRTSTAGTTPVVSKTVTPFFNRFVYVGVGGVSKKSKKIYVGVNGQSKLVKKIYVGVNGQSKLVYKSS